MGPDRYERLSRTTYSSAACFRIWLEIHHGWMSLIFGSLGLSLVRCQITGQPEIRTVPHGQEYVGGGFDANSWHGHQDRVKREVLKHLLDLLRNGFPSFQQGLDIGGQLRDHQLRCRGARHRNGLGLASLEDLIHERRGIFLCSFAHPSHHPVIADLLQLRRRGRSGSTSPAPAMITLPGCSIRTSLTPGGSLQCMNYG